MSGQRKGGIISLQVGGVGQDCKGDATYDLGNPERSAIVGTSGVHGYSEKPKVAYVEVELTDRGDLDVSALENTTDKTVTLVLANGKTIMLPRAYYAGKGEHNSGEGQFTARFESALQGQEV